MANIIGIGSDMEGPYQPGFSKTVGKYEGPTEPAPMGKVQPAHMGSQSSAPRKEDNSMYETGQRYGSSGFDVLNQMKK